MNGSILPVAASRMEAPCESYDPGAVLAVTVRSGLRRASHEVWRSVVPHPCSPPGAGTVFRDPDCESPRGAWALRSAGEFGVLAHEAFDVGGVDGQCLGNG